MFGDSTIHQLLGPFSLPPRLAPVPNSDNTEPGLRHFTSVIWARLESQVKHNHCSKWLVSLPWFLQILCFQSFEMFRMFGIECKPYLAFLQGRVEQGSHLCKYSSPCPAWAQSVNFNQRKGTQRNIGHALTIIHHLTHLWNASHGNHTVTNMHTLQTRELDGKCPQPLALLWRL